MDIKVDTAVSFLDIFIVLVLIWAIFKGYKRGPVVHALSLLVIVIGIAVFGIVSESIADFVRDRATVSMDNLHLYIFAILFLASCWLSNFVAGKVEKGSSKPKGILIIALGILVSIIKYLYILSITLLFFAKFDNSYNLVGASEKSRTKLYTTVKSIAPETIKTVSFLKD